MIEMIRDFARCFETSFDIKEALVNNKGQIFLLRGSQKKYVSKDFYYAGTYIGKVEDEKFVPSFSLLNMIAATEANKVYVDKKTEWLFICGRDIFAKGITRTLGSKTKNSYVLVLNQYSECLGFGRTVGDLNKKERRVAVQNLLDIGDFLRRER